MFTQHYLLICVFLACSCGISQCNKEKSNSLATLTDCLKRTSGLSDLESWIHCRERTETAVARSKRLALSSEHDTSGSIVSDLSQLGSYAALEDGLLVTKNERIEVSSVELQKSRCDEKNDRKFYFTEDHADKIAWVQKADLELGSTEKRLSRRDEGTGSHHTTRVKHAADVITAVTFTVLFLLIFTFFTVCRTQSVAFRNRQQKMEQQNEADSLGTGSSKMTSTDSHKSTIGSSLGRAIALVMTNLEAKKKEGKEFTSEMRPEYVAEMLRDACEEVLLPVLGRQESHRFAHDLSSAYKEIHLVHSRLQTFSIPGIVDGQAGSSPAGGSAAPQPHQSGREGREDPELKPFRNVGELRSERLRNSLEDAVTGIQAIHVPNGSTETHLNVGRETKGGFVDTPFTVSRSERDGEGEGEGEVGAESVSIETAHFQRLKVETVDGEPPEEWIHEERMRFFGKREGTEMPCEGSERQAMEETEREWQKNGREMEGDGDSIHALLPVTEPLCQVALTHTSVRVREGGRGDKEEVESSVLERLAAAYETRNHLTVAKLRLGSRQLDVQSQHLDLASESNSLMRSSVGIGRKRNEMKERDREEQRAGEVLRELIAQLADELITGLWVMVVALMGAGWWLAKDRLREEVTVCYKNVQTPRSWFNFWSSQWVNELSCQVFIFGRLVFGLAILVLFSSYLVHKDAADMQRRPVFMIIFVMGVLGGFVGNNTVESVGGVGIRWLLCWEALCAFHVAGVWYPKQMYYFVNRCHPKNPEESSARGNYDRSYERRQELLSTKVRKFGIHALIVLVLPLAAGVWPFL